MDSALLPTTVALCHLTYFWLQAKNKEKHGFLSVTTEDATTQKKNIAFKIWGSINQ